jgi:hypothetical protein
METQSLSDFLTALSEDDDQLERYRSDPHGFLAGANIADEHRDLLKAGDVRSIHEVLRQEQGLKQAGGARPCFVVFIERA